MPLSSLPSFSPVLPALLKFAKNRCIPWRARLFLRFRAYSFLFASCGVYIARRCGCCTYATAHACTCCHHCACCSGMAAAAVWTNFWRRVVAVRTGQPAHIPCAHLSVARTLPPRTFACPARFLRHFHWVRPTGKTLPSSCSLQDMCRCYRPLSASLSISWAFRKTETGRSWRGGLATCLSPPFLPLCAFPILCSLQSNSATFPGQAAGVATSWRTGGEDKDLGQAFF